MAEGTGLDAAITAVTVFKDGARVQRSGTVSVGPGLRPMVIGSLPATVDRPRFGSRPMGGIWFC